MIKFYKSVNGIINEIEGPVSGCWISVVEPTEQEVHLLRTMVLTAVS